jgi:hypothetical protein
LHDQGARADKALFAVLADPNEDPVLRAEAHPLLAPRLAQPVYDLQSKGLLPRPEIPPVETLFHNLPLFERDTEGEWVLTPGAIRLSHLVYPDDLIEVLHDAPRNPTRACAAAALAALVAQRLPAATSRLAEALRSAQGIEVHLNAVIAGRPHAFCLAELCAEALRAIGNRI